MADTRVWTTHGFGKRGCSAKIVCRNCGYMVVVSQTKMAFMFPKVLPLSDAVAKLICSKCRARNADLFVVRPPERG